MEQGKNVNEVTDDLEREGQDFNEGDSLVKESTETEENRVKETALSILEVIGSIAIGVISFIGTAFRALVFGDSKPFDIVSKLHNDKTKKDINKQIKEDRQKGKEENNRDTKDSREQKDKNEKNQNEKENNAKEDKSKEKIDYKKQQDLYNLIVDEKSLDILAKYGIVLENDYVKLNGKNVISAKELKDKEIINAFKTAFVIDNINLDGNEKNMSPLKDDKAIRLAASLKTMLLFTELKLLHNENLTKMDLRNEEMTHIIGDGFESSDIFSHISIDKDISNYATEKDVIVQSDIAIKYNDLEMCRIKADELKDKNIEDIISEFLDKYDKELRKEHVIENGDQKITFNVDYNNKVYVNYTNGTNTSSLGQFTVKETTDIKKITEAIKETAWEHGNENVKASVVGYTIGLMTNPNMVDSVKNRKIYNPLLDETNYVNKVQVHANREDSIIKIKRYEVKDYGTDGKPVFDKNKIMTMRYSVGKDVNNLDSIIKTLQKEYNKEIEIINSIKKEDKDISKNEESIQDNTENKDINNTEKTNNNSIPERKINESLYEYIVNNNGAVVSKETEKSMEKMLDAMPKIKVEPETNLENEDIQNEDDVVEIPENIIFEQKPFDIGEEEIEI